MSEPTPDEIRRVITWLAGMAVRDARPDPGLLTRQIVDAVGTPEIGQSVIVLVAYAHDLYEGVAVVEEVTVDAWKGLEFVFVYDWDEDLLGPDGPHPKVLAVAPAPEVIG